MTKDIDFVWPLLQQHQGETFYTAKGLPFTYTIRGGELFVHRGECTGKNCRVGNGRYPHHWAEENRLLWGKLSLSGTACAGDFYHSRQQSKCERNMKSIQFTSFP